MLLNHTLLPPSGIFFIVNGMLCRICLLILPSGLKGHHLVHKVCDRTVRPESKGNVKVYAQTEMELFLTRNSGRRNKNKSKED